MRMEILLGIGFLFNISLNPLALAALKNIIVAQQKNQLALRE